jgi:hypothetical protein
MSHSNGSWVGKHTHIHTHTHTHTHTHIHTYTHTPRHEVTQSNRGVSPLILNVGTKQKGLVGLLHAPATSLPEKNPGDKR